MIFYCPKCNNPLSYFDNCGTNVGVDGSCGTKQNYYERTSRFSSYCNRCNRNYTIVHREIDQLEDDSDTYTNKGVSISNEETNYGGKR